MACAYTFIIHTQRDEKLMKYSISAVLAERREEHEPSLSTIWFPFLSFFLFSFNQIHSERTELKEKI